MTLFTVTVYVLFHFGLDRDSLDGELASGVLWVTLLLAAVIGVTRLFAAEREQGGIDALLLAPVDRTALFVAKAAALFLYLVALELVAVPAFGAAAARARTCSTRCPSSLLILLLADVGLAAVGALVSALAAETRARELIVPLLLLPLLVPLLIGAASATEPLLRGAAAPEDLGRFLALLARLRRGVPADRPGRLRLSPGRLSFEARCTPRASGRLRPPPSSPPRWRSRSSSSTRRWTPTRASSRRSSTCTCRWRSWRCAASWPAAIMAIQHLRTGDRSWDMRSLRGHPHVDHPRHGRAGHRRDLGQGGVGPLVGVGRAGAGVVPGRLPPLLRLLPAALLDRGPRAPGALLVGVRDRRRAPSCRSTSWRCGWRSRSPTRACCRRPAAACPATCGSPSSSACSR